MALHELSDKEVRNTKPAGKEYLLADGGGLFLRVRSTGAKDWLFIYTFTGTRRKFGLGSLDAVPLVTARSEAAKARESVKQQIDPQVQRKLRQAEQKEQRRILEAAQARLTVRDLFGRWAAVDLTRRKDGGKEIRRMFEKDVLPHLGSLAVEDVKKGHITLVTDPLLARGVNRMAKLIFSLMRQMFRFAVDRDLIEADPTASIRKSKIGGADTERDRALTEDEVKNLARQLPNAGLSNATRVAVWITLSTCCRIGELMLTRLEHIDFEKNTWWIPPENSKNGKAHTIYLSAFALTQFQALKNSGEAAVKARDNDDVNEAKPCVWVYPNRSGKGPLGPKTVTKQIGDRQRPGLTPMKGRSKAELSDTLVLAGGKWTPHDLRRTGATLMVSLGVLPEVAERCLNHAEENKVKRIYQRHTYENEMREAWILLGERLELLTRNDAENVVTPREAT